MAATVGLGAVRRGYGATSEGTVTSVGLVADQVSRASVGVPVLVVIDDLDGLVPSVAATLIERLCGRPDGRVLVADPPTDGVALVIDVLSGGPHCCVRR